MHEIYYLIISFRKYTEKHHYTGEFSVSETLYRQALIEQDRNFEEINRGTFYQSAGKIDDILDPEVILAAPLLSCRNRIIFVDKK